jgi:hypothetical protein
VGDRRLSAALTFSATATNATASGARAVSFEMPKIYMPYTARCNPNVDEAHRHTRAWAKSVGLLDSGVWTEQDLDSTDYARYAALCHPDAPGPTQNLVTDWFGLTFFFDDFFLETFKRTNDLARAKRYVSRLPVFMPLLPGVLPVPTDAFERGLVDLWPRTMFAMSPELLRRFRGHVIEYVDGTLWELRNRFHDWVPDPVEYVEMRRWFGGATFTRDLVQYGVGAEIPTHIHDTRTIDALFRAWADWVTISNDLFSFLRESQLENDIHTELQELFDDWDMGATERAGIVRHVQGLHGIGCPARSRSCSSHLATRTDAQPAVGRRPGASSRHSRHAAFASRRVLWDVGRAQRPSPRSSIVWAGGLRSARRVATLWDQ